jgi:hypothetical protein
MDNFAFTICKTSPDLLAGYISQLTKYDLHLPVISLLQKLFHNYLWVKAKLNRIF